MIPKIIHYCWFGYGQKPKLAEKCIKSWIKYCPDYEIICWDESNYDISAAPLYVRQAYEAKKWAFVTDYVRLQVVYEHGGIYLDTDVELLKSLDPFLCLYAFAGCEGAQYVNTGLGFGAEKGNSFLRANMKMYEGMKPLRESGDFEASPCPHYTTQLLKDMGVEFPICKITEISGIVTLYPNEFFNPLDWKHNKLRVTENTVSIHHYGSSWMTEEQRKNLIHNFRMAEIEKKYGKWIAKTADFCYWSQRINGGPGLLSKIAHRMVRKNNE